MVWAVVVCLALGNDILDGASIVATISSVITIRKAAQSPGVAEEDLR